MRCLLLFFLTFFWATPAFGGILLLWEATKKPVIDLKVEDPITHEITEREMTEEELAKIALHEARDANFKTIQDSVKDTMTGNYARVIDNKGPVWVRDGTRYMIAYFADPRRIKKELNPSGACDVINTGKLSGAEWLIKNGYEAESNDLVEAKVEPK